MAPASADTEAGQPARFLPSGAEVIVRPGETLLEAASRAGLALPFSCREGICGTCRLRKLSGEVQMDDNGGLFDDEIAAGDILACCARPLTAVVVECP